MASFLTALIQLVTGCRGHSLFFKQGYNVSGGKVFYKNAFPGPTEEVKNADAGSFKVISLPGDTSVESNKYFAVDKNHVFYTGYILIGSDGASFTIINENFAKDKKQCYFRGQIIPGADPLSFIVKEGVFSADKKNIYQRTQLLDNNTSLFETFRDSHIAHTQHAVYVFDAVIPVPANALFKHLGYNYFSLGDQLYFQDKPMTVEYPQTFRAINDFYAQTDNQVFYGGNIIQGADAKTFVLLKGPYGKDKKKVFFFNKTVAGADPGSFEIINVNFQCARDKHALFHEDKTIKNTTAADLANKNTCTQCNENAIYFSNAQ